MLCWCFDVCLNALVCFVLSALHLNKWVCRCKVQISRFVAVKRISCCADYFWCVFMCVNVWGHVGFHGVCGLDLFKSVGVHTRKHLLHAQIRTCVCFHGVFVNEIYLKITWSTLKAQPRNFSVSVSVSVLCVRASFCREQLRSVGVCACVCSATKSCTLACDSYTQPRGLCML